MFGWIFVFIFSKNIFPNKPKTKNDQISFSLFYVETKNLIWDKIKTRNENTNETHSCVMVLIINFIKKFNSILISFMKMKINF